MGLISLLWGIVAMIWMIVALIPLLGWGNWFLIPFAAVGAIIAAIGVLFTAPGNRGRAKTGLALNGLVIVVAVGRLVLGGGIVGVASRRSGVKCRHDLPLPPPAAHAPRRLLAPADARVPPHPPPPRLTGLPGPNG